MIIRRWREDAPPTRTCTCSRAPSARASAASPHAGGRHFDRTIPKSTSTRGSPSTARSARNGSSAQTETVGAPRGVRHLPQHDVTTSAAGTWRLGRQVAGRARFTLDPGGATPARRRQLANVENGGGAGSAARPTPTPPRAAWHVERAVLHQQLARLTRRGELVRPRRSEDLARPCRQVLAHPHQNPLRERNLVVADLARDEDVDGRSVIRAEHLAQRRVHCAGEAWVVPGRQDV